jgi:hypothetical protein
MQTQNTREAELEKRSCLAFGASSWGPMLCAQPGVQKRTSLIVASSVPVAQQPRRMADRNPGVQVTCCVGNAGAVPLSSVITNFSKFSVGQCNASAAATCRDHSSQDSGVRSIKGWRAPCASANCRSSRYNPQISCSKAPRTRSRVPPMPRLGARARASVASTAVSRDLRAP